jgi:SAM-dependent methyltransferase
VSHPLHECPCCRAEAAEFCAEPEPHLHCARCDHRWRNSPALSGEYYARLTGRNAASARALERKLDGRLAALRSLVQNGQRLLEIGCAEGALGARIKQEFRVHYAGIEPSKDAAAAAAVLDEVHPSASDDRMREPFDGVLSFHVLEHIEDVAAQLALVRRWLRADGWLLLEVPHGSGHADLSWDRNPEHVHQFSVASLVTLLARSGFVAHRVETGHFESPTYNDSVRVLARPARDAAVRRAALLARVRRRLPGGFLVRGTGGDFRKFIEPLLAELGVIGLIGEAGTAAGRPVVPYAAGHARLPILVCSLYFEDEIVGDLIRLGHPEVAIVRLSELLENS